MIHLRDIADVWREMHVAYGKYQAAVDADIAAGINYPAPPSAATAALLDAYVALALEHEALRIAAQPKRRAHTPEEWAAHVAACVKRGLYPDEDHGVAVSE